MKNILNFCMILVLISFFQLHAQDTVGTSVENIDTTTIKADKINLKIDLVPSTTYRYTNSLSQKIKQELLGNPIEAIKTVKYTATCEIVSNDGKETIIKALYERITINIDMPQGDFTFDSEKDSASSFITRIVDRPFLIYLNQQGKVEKEEELSDILAETELMDQSAVLALAGLELLNEYRIAKVLEADFTTLPDHPIGIGDNWEKNSQQRINNQFDLNKKTIYTLESLNEDLAWINLEGALASSIGDENSIGEVNMEGSQNGILEVDRSTGLILSNDTHQEVEGSMRAQGFEVPIAIVTDSSIKGEKL